MVSVPDISWLDDSACLASNAGTRNRLSYSVIYLSASARIVIRVARAGLSPADTDCRQRFSRGLSISYHKSWRAHMRFSFGAMILLGIVFLLIVGTAPASMTARPSSRSHGRGCVPDWRVRTSRRRTRCGGGDTGHLEGSRPRPRLGGLGREWRGWCRPLGGTAWSITRCFGWAFLRHFDRWQTTKPLPCATPWSGAIVKPTTSRWSGATCR